MIVLALLMVANFAEAQQFLTPVSSLTGDAVAETQDGKTISGDIRMAVLGPKGLIKFRIKDEGTGEVFKFEAEQVKTLRVKMDGLAKLETFAQQTSTISRLSNANFDEAQEREFIYYHTVAWPDKPGKYMLVQLLNAGWESKVKVYDYPAKKTGTTSIGGIDVAGGEAKSYVVDYLGTTSIVDKKNYKKSHFDKMFGGCEAITSLEENQSGFDDFALHVFLFEKECE